MGGMANTNAPQNASSMGQMLNLAHELSEAEQAYNAAHDALCGYALTFSKADEFGAGRENAVKELSQRAMAYAEARTRYALLQLHVAERQGRR